MMPLSSLKKAELLELVELALSRQALLYTDIIQSKKQSLRAACMLFGSIRAFSRRFGYDSGNLSRWLLGHPTLSASKVDALLEALGLPGMCPHHDRVHHWTPSLRCDLEAALTLYCPRGASFALLHQSKHAPALYAVHDGDLCALMRVPYRYEIPKGREVRNRLGDAAGFLSAPLSVRAFKAAWNGSTSQPEAPSLEDILTSMDRHGVTISEAVSRLWVEGK